MKEHPISTQFGLALHWTRLWCWFRPL